MEKLDTLEILRKKKKKKKSFSKPTEYEVLLC